MADPHPGTGRRGYTGAQVPAVVPCALELIPDRAGRAPLHPLHAPGTPTHAACRAMPCPQHTAHGAQCQGRHARGCGVGRGVAWRGVMVRARVCVNACVCGVWGAGGVGGLPKGDETRCTNHREGAMI